MSLKGGQEEAGEGLPRTAQCLLSAFFRVRPVRNKEELAKENEEGGGVRCPTSSCKGTEGSSPLVLIAGGV